MIGVHASENWVPCTTRNLIADGKLAIGDGYRAKNSELSGEGLPFARAGNINSGFHFVDADRFPVKEIAKVGDKVSQPGDVVFTSKGTVGRLALVRLTTPRFVYSPQLCYWRSLNQEAIDSRWLYFWMHGSEFGYQVAGLKGQTDMADYVSLSDQRNMEISLPPIAEQRAIASVLGALDDKIEQNRRTALALEKLAQAIFRAWFVDFEPVKAKAAGATRFPSMPQPVFDALPTCFVDSDIGPVPEGWEVKALANAATFLNGLALQKYPPRGDDDDLPVIKIAQLRKGSTDGADLANGDVPEQYVIGDGDLLFSWSGTLEAAFWFGGKGALNQHLFKVASDEHPSWLCLLWVQQHLPWFRTIAAGKATTMGHIKRGHLMEAQVVTAMPKVLQAADAIIGPVYDLYAQTMLESRKLAQMRDYLLPKLLSGQIRVRDAERKAATVP
ncbi:restriction endonuclease subunit S [Comamonas flocculans]|uniref:Restriction endonuclease subunit S n=1 Tax=Comamonas flocculans TaxID=2597701 RepID=A0A5B8RTV2_9BURK|nr:restriction endonuclease subunit S [Comamonas flocculans]QEA11665.1 restriction endonuclease subunit S [Comamonas flocculans]